MRKLAAIAGIAAAGLGVQATAYGYSANATVTFSWATDGTDKGWTAQGANTLTVLSDSTYFTQQSGNNSTGYYNSDFASAAQCATIVAGLGGTPTSTRKYGCRYNDYDGNAQFASTPVADVGPNGASASGNIVVTDNTLTGTITIVGTTDEPTGGTAANVGLGANGYNLRQADGSPFGNSWGGVTTLGTYTLALTGTFNDSSWQITGGTARFNDTGFLCQQGGNSSPTNILCNASAAPGGASATGGALSWGWDLDGGAGAGTAMSEILVTDLAGSTIDTISGVLASLSVDTNGVISTNSGEIRRALGSTSGCGLGTGVQNIQYDAALDRISCGTLTVASLNVTGQVAVIPAPPAVWLLGTGIAALVARRRFKKAA